MHPFLRLLDQGPTLNGVRCVCVCACVRVPAEKGDVVPGKLGQANAVSRSVLSRGILRFESEVESVVESISQSVTQSSARLRNALHRKVLPKVWSVCHSPWTAQEELFVQGAVSSAYWLTSVAKLRYTSLQSLGPIAVCELRNGIQYNYMIVDQRNGWSTHTQRAYIRWNRDCANKASIVALTVAQTYAIEPTAPGPTAALSIVCAL